MSSQEQISKLHGLLERIQKNASRPRASAPTATAPVAFAPATAASPAPVTYVAPAPSFDAVDDLLMGSPEQSPLPVDVDIPLDSVPPVAEISPSQAPDAEPIPLVSVSSGHAAPPPVDDPFGLESEVSEVRVTTAPREPADEVTVAAIEAEAEPIGTEELSEDDLVDVTEGTPPPAATDVDIDFEEEEEQPPASSQRSRVASSMDEALAAAAANQLDREREVPLKTPPPESGPQAAPAPTGLAAPDAPDVDSLLGGELEIPTRAAGLGDRGPTPEQLGQTIDLEEARGPSLELAEHRASTPAPPALEELEAPLPGPTLVGGYDASLEPPPEARDELEAHRRRLEDDLAPPPESLATLPSVQPGAHLAEIVPIFQAAEGPELIARLVQTASPESFVSVRETFRPGSFVELLDASLALDGQ